MNDAADELEFEKAAELRDKILSAQGDGSGIASGVPDDVGGAAEEGRTRGRWNRTRLVRAGSPQAALMSEEWLTKKLDQLPTGPGVYLMKDHQGAVIYVGKAVNLRNRVRSYFTRSSDSRAFIPLLEEIVGDIETVLVTNEKEALLLENELIKRHSPRFNIRLKDDKNFICLRLDTSQTYPRLEIVRRFKKDGAHYFGPYSSAISIRETLRTVNKYFQLRTCSDHALENRRRPCLLFQIGRCPAPCVNPIPRDDYHRNVAEVMLFLEGKGQELVGSLRMRMQTAAKDQKFEDAARLRDQLFSIERSLERQKIAFSEPIDQDVFAYYREADRFLVYVLYVRQGRLNGGQAFPFTGPGVPGRRALARSSISTTRRTTWCQRKSCFHVEPEGGIEGSGELLAERRGSKVRVLVPARGEKARFTSRWRRKTHSRLSETSSGQQG